jgi:hypothetical protein
MSDKSKYENHSARRSAKTAGIQGAILRRKDVAVLFEPVADIFALLAGISIQAVPVVPIPLTSLPPETVAQRPLMRPGLPGRRFPQRHEPPVYSNRRGVLLNTEQLHTRSIIMETGTI